MVRYGAVAASRVGASACATFLAGHFKERFHHNKLVA